MDAVLAIWSAIAAGGPTAIIAILTVAVVYLGFERFRMIKIIREYQQMIADNRTKYGESIIDLIDRYHDGNLELMKALNEIKVVLSMMQKTLL